MGLFNGFYNLTEDLCAAAPVTLVGADWVEATPPAYFEVLGTAMAGLALACGKRRRRRSFESTRR